MVDDSRRIPKRSLEAPEAEDEGRELPALLGGAGGAAEAAGARDGFEASESAQGKLQKLSAEYLGAGAAAFPSLEERILEMQNKLFPGGRAAPREALEYLLGAPVDGEIVVAALEKYQKNFVDSAVSGAISAILSRIGQDRDYAKEYHVALVAVASAGVHLSRGQFEYLIDQLIDAEHPEGRESVLEAMGKSQSLASQVREYLKKNHSEMDGEAIFRILTALKRSKQNIFDPTSEAYFPGCGLLLKKLNDDQVVEVVGGDDFEEVNPLGNSRITEASIFRLTEDLRLAGEERSLFLMLQMKSGVRDTTLQFLAKKPDLDLELAHILKTLCEAGYLKQLIKISDQQDVFGRIWLHYAQSASLKYFINAICELPSSDFPLELLNIQSHYGRYWISERPPCNTGDNLWKLAVATPLEAKFKMIQKYDQGLFFWLIMGEDSEGQAQLTQAFANYILKSVQEMDYLMGRKLTGRWGDHPIGIICEACALSLKITEFESEDLENFWKLEIPRVLQYLPAEQKSEFFASIPFESFEEVVDSGINIFGHPPEPQDKAKFLVGLLGDRDSIGTELREDLEFAHGWGGYSELTPYYYMKILNGIGSDKGVPLPERALAQELVDVFRDTFAFFPNRNFPRLGTWSSDVSQQMQRLIVPGTVGFLDLNLFNAGFGAAKHHAATDPAKKRGHSHRTFRINVKDICSIDFWMKIEARLFEVHGVDEIYDLLAKFDANSRRDGLERAPVAIAQDNFFPLSADSHLLGIHFAKGKGVLSDELRETNFQQAGNCYVRTMKEMVRAITHDRLRDRVAEITFSKRIKEGAATLFPELIESDPRFSGLAKRKVKRAEVRSAASVMAADDAQFSDCVNRMASDMSVARLEAICPGYPLDFHGEFPEGFQENKPEAILQWMLDKNRSDREKQQMMVAYIEGHNKSEWR